MCTVVQFAFIIQLVLSTNNITVSYENRPHRSELTNVSLTFFPGEITAIVGPNGSGKSTLVRSLSRVQKPILGCVLLDGKDLYTRVTANSSARKIGVVPQDTHVSLEFSSREIVAMGLTPYRDGWSSFAAISDEDGTLIDAALQSVSLSGDIADRPVMTLSGGERQRALIARALIQRTEVIILDEPTASLDLRHQAALFSELTELATVYNKAVVVVLHDLNAASAIAQRIIMLKDGKVAADGSPQMVLIPKTIEEVYGVRAAITDDYANGSRRVTLLSENLLLPELRGKSIHVICGGGAGGKLLLWLKSSGAVLTAGPLNEGDVDQCLAEQNNIPHTRVPMFEPVPALDVRDISQIADSSDVILFTPGSIGQGNLESLFSVERLSQMGKVVVVTKTVADTIRHMHGSLPATAARAWNELMSRHKTIVVDSPAGLLKAISGGISA